MRGLIQQLQTMPEAVRLDVMDRARRKQLNRTMNASPLIRQAKIQPMSLSALMANNRAPGRPIPPRSMGGTLGSLMRQQ